MMATTDRLAQLINKLNKSWRKDAKKAVKYLICTPNTGHPVLGVF